MNKSIKNIIFDFGGVIIPIDPMAFARSLIKLGCDDVPGLHESFLKEDIYTRFEKGELNPSQFRDRLRAGLNNHATDKELDHAWNTILGEIPPEHVTLLGSLKSSYRTFLLSNTNQIHYDHYQSGFFITYGPASLDSLFEKAYYSFQLKLYKPDPAIFEFVLNDSGLDPSETLFIDDYLVNVEAAMDCGLQAIHLSDGMGVMNLFNSSSRIKM